MNDINIQEFIRYGASGIEVANFTEIRSALIAKYKEAYGSDIDLSTASADGVFVNDLSLMINNLLQTFVTMYANLDADYATGSYLDTLCNLSNVTRRQATHSNASLLVQNIGTTKLTNIRSLTFFDNAGNEWDFASETGISFEINETKELTVTCSVPGAVKAPAGFISNLVDVYPLAISQPMNANVGHDIETDDELRARRSQSAGSSGMTVLESLVGALRNISGIQDVFIYNNNTNDSITAKDTTSVAAHSIYVITRNEAGVSIDDATIGSIIHNKLTPGISTAAMASGIASGIAKNYNFIEQAYGQSIPDTNQIQNWKQAVGIHPEVKIVINAYEYFSSDETNVIGQAIINYLNALPLSTNLNKNNILIQAVYADPKFKGNATYGVTEIIANTTVNPDSFYNYTTINAVQDEEDTTKWTITLS